MEIDLSEVSIPQQCAKCNEEKGTQFLQCNKCVALFCGETCWNEFVLHSRKYPTAQEHEPIHLEELNSIAEADHIVFAKVSEERQRELHELDAYSYWFGINTKEGNAGVNCNLYTEIILRSNFEDKTKQFPSLVSFVGETGAGKSTIIKGLLNQDRGSKTEARNSWGPISGIQDLFAGPTSSDVHLYADVMTIDTDRPIMWADCEGLRGGESNPISSFCKDTMNIARRIFTYKGTDNSEETKALTRAYCVENVYPRVLYAFSDILCYVVQTNPRHLESIAEQLITWADKVHHTSLNQTTLPRAILVLNNISLTTEDQKNWSNEKWATKKAYETLMRCTILSPSLTKIAQKWNAILPEKNQITSIMRLFLLYYKSLSVVYIPSRSSGSAASVFFRQLQLLRTSIYNLSNEVIQEKFQNSTQTNSEALESVLNDGLKHFFTKFGEPFDFFKHAITHRPSQQDLTSYATTLMMEIREGETNSQIFDKRCAKLFASYRSLILLSDKNFGSSFLNSYVYTRHYRSAYEGVYQKSRCWYQKGTRTCRNTADGHQKGHQDSCGLIIDSGDYQTPYTDEASDEFIKNIVRLSDPTWSHFRGQSSTDIQPFLEEHLETLAAERAFWKETFSNTICFSCIREAPDFALICGHTICRTCVKLFGQRTSEEAVYNLRCCPLCLQGSQNSDFWAQIRLKPAEAGVRVLAIDGGGVRGVISVRILERLEKEIGLGLPLAHFFDVIIGTSSGGIISLALGANLWSAKRCREVFEDFARSSFIARPLARIPLVGHFVSYLLDSYYQEEPLDMAFHAIFAPSNDFDERKLFNEPVTIIKSPDTKNPVQQHFLRDIKIAVTTVSTLSSSKTTIMSNYNRKRFDENSCPIYRADEAWLEVDLVEAARCTSAAPYIFPIYRTANDQTFQDGGLNENNPVGLAVREAKSLWSEFSTLDIAVSVGTGWTKHGSEGSGSVTSKTTNGWLKRCIESFESKLDSELLWREYKASLSKEQENRHRRLNVELPGKLPFISEVSKLSMLQQATMSSFEDVDVHRELQQTAEALLASIFYPVIDHYLRKSRDDFCFKGRILCRLEQEHQKTLLERLRSSGSRFYVNTTAHEIDFSDQITRIELGGSFEQEIWGPLQLNGEVSMLLSFVGGSSPEHPVPSSISLSKYPISHSPVRVSPAITFSSC